MSASYPAQIPRVLSEFEHEVGNFRNALQVPGPQRLVPLVRYTMIKNANFDFLPSFSEAFEAFVEYGSSRDRNDSRSFNDGLWDLPTPMAYGIYPLNELDGDATAILFSTSRWFWMIVQREN